MAAAARIPDFERVDAALARCGIGIDASELQGLLAGYLAAGGPLAASDWLAPLHVDADARRVADDRDLDDLFRGTREALEDGEFGFDLLLPGEAAPLGERIDALFDWCRGFLSGVALVPERPALSPEAQEAFDDLAGIAAFSVDEDEQDEDALIEITEFVRVAVLLIHGDARSAPGRGARLH